MNNQDKKNYHQDFGMQKRVRQNLDIYLIQDPEECKMDLSIALNIGCSHYDFELLYSRKEKK